MSIFAQQTIDLNLVPGDVLPVINVSQNNASGWQINFRLFNGATRYDIPTDVNVRLDMTKRDGHGISANATKNSTIPSMCYVWLTEQMVAVEGDQIAELVLTHSGDSRSIGTINFILRVEEAALRDDAIMSDSEINYVQQKINQWSGLAAYGDALDGALARITAVEDGKAPNNHASTDPTYGVGTQYSYGHLKLWGISSTNPPSTGQYAMDAVNVVEWYKAMLQAPWYPGDATNPGWTYGWRFVSADSRTYCRCAAGCVYTVTFTAKVGSEGLAAATSVTIISNLPEAATRIYVQAYFVTYTGSTPSSVTPVMCAIRPENTDISNPARVLQIDGATNPVSIPAGATIFGTFTYVSSR